MHLKTSDSKVRFAFLVHPTSLESFYFILGLYGNLARKVPKIYMKDLLTKIPPYKFIHVGEIRSTLGMSVDGVFILCPLLPENFVSLAPSVVLDKLIGGIKLSNKLRANIVGLGGFTSIFSNQGLDLIDKSQVSVTTGNTYTASLVVESILKAVDVLNYDIKKITLGVIGAAGDIGSACVKFFSNKVGRIILCGRSESKLAELANSLRIQNSSRIEVTQDFATLVPISDIVVTATSAITTILSSKLLKKGSIVCDVSLPPNIAREVIKDRDDVLVYEGGCVVPPFFDEIRDVDFKKHFPNGAIFGCLAETIILALEKKFENFSIGRGSISISRMIEINSIGRKHGFKVAPFFCGSKKYRNEDIEKIKNSIPAHLLKQ